MLQDSRPGASQLLTACLLTCLQAGRRPPVHDGRSAHGILPLAAAVAQVSRSAYPPSPLLAPPWSPRFHAVPPTAPTAAPLHPFTAFTGLACGSPTPISPTRAQAAQPRLGALHGPCGALFMGSLHEDSAEYVPTDCAKVLCNRLHAAAPLMSAEISPLHVLCDLVHLGSLLTSAAPSPLQVLCDLVSVGSFIRTASYHPSRCSAISCTVSSAPLIVCVVASPIPSCPPHYHLSRHCQGLRRLAHSLVSAALSPSRQPL